MFTINLVIADNPQKQHCKIKELLKSNSIIEIELKYDGHLTKEDYDYLRTFIQQCEDKQLLEKIYYAILKNIYINQDKNLHNPDNIEILCMLMSKDKIPIKSESIKNQIFDTFHYGHFPKKAEKILIERFKQSPSKKFALLLGRYYSEDNSGIEALKSELNNPNPEIKEAVKLALARRGDKTIQEEEINRLVKKLKKVVNTNKDNRKIFDSIYECTWKLEYINSVQSIFLLLKNIILSKWSPRHAEKGEIIYGFFLEYNIKDNNKNILSISKTFQSWNKNKDLLRKQLENNLPNHDEFIISRAKNCLSKSIENFKKKGFEYLVSIDIEYMLSKIKCINFKVRNNQEYRSQLQSITKYETEFKNYGKKLDKKYLEKYSWEIEEFNKQLNEIKEKSEK